MSLQLSAAPCVALLGGGMHVDDRRLLVNRGVCLTTGPFIPGRSGHSAVGEHECGRSWQSAEAAEHRPYRCPTDRPMRTGAATRPPPIRRLPVVAQCVVGERRSPVWQCTAGPLVGFAYRPRRSTALTHSRERGRTARTGHVRLPPPHGCGTGRALKPVDSAVGAKQTYSSAAYRIGGAPCTGRRERQAERQPD